MAKITSRKFDPASKLEIVTLEDGFGSPMIVQHPLSRTAAERDADEAAAMALLDSNEAEFRALMASREGK